MMTTARCPHCFHWATGRAASNGPKPAFSYNLYLKLLPFGFIFQRSVILMFAEWNVTQNVYWLLGFFVMFISFLFMYKC